MLTSQEGPCSVELVIQEHFNWALNLKRFTCKCEISQGMKVNEDRTNTLKDRERSIRVF